MRCHITIPVSSSNNNELESCTCIATAPAALLQSPEQHLSLSWVSCSVLPQNVGGGGGGGVGSEIKVVVVLRREGREIFH